MNDKLWILLFNNVATITGIITGGFVFLQIFNSYNDRKQKENVEKAKQNSVGQEALDVLMKGQKEIRDDLHEMDVKLKEIQNDEMKYHQYLQDYKEGLQQRFDKLKEHVEKTTMDLLRIFTNQK